MKLGPLREGQIRAHDQFIIFKTSQDKNLIMRTYKSVVKYTLYGVP